MKIVRQSGPKHHRKSSVLRRCRKTVSDVDGRLFHTREAAIGNARSPMVEWRVDFPYINSVLKPCEKLKRLIQ